MLHHPKTKTNSTSQRHIEASSCSLQTGHLSHVFICHTPSEQHLLVIPSLYDHVYYREWGFYQEFDGLRIIEFASLEISIAFVLDSKLFTISKTGKKSLGRHTSLGWY